MATDEHNVEVLSPDAEYITSNTNAYSIIKTIGHCFDDGRVFLATSRELVGTMPVPMHSKVVAIRQYCLEKSHQELGLFLKEVGLMRLLKHSNILLCFDSFVVDKSLYIVTPLVDYGSALDLIQSHFFNGFPEMVIAGIIRDILGALIYMHSKGYIHRNIRASHILISSQGQAILSGLRDAYSIVEKGRWQRAVYDYPSNPQRSFCWLSPELLQQNLRGYSEKSDIYSLGITACELANGIPPYIDLPCTQLLISKLNGPPPQLWDCNTVPSPENRVVPTEAPDSGVFDGVTANSNIDARLEAAFQRSFTRPFHRFTMLCVQHEPSLRPGAPQLMKHPFIQASRKGSTANWIEYLTCVPSIGMRSDECSTIDSPVEGTETNDEIIDWNFDCQEIDWTKPNMNINLTEPDLKKPDIKIDLVGTDSENEENESFV